MTDDDELQAAWVSFGQALRENERAKIKREWIMLGQSRSILEDQSHARQWDEAMNYQRMMSSMNQRQYRNPPRGLVSGPLGFLGL